MSKKEKKEKKGFFKEFGEFINRGNALALAIGVIIGGAFTSIVTAINKNIISPIIAWIIGDTDLSNSLVTVLKSHDIATQADVANGLAAAIGDPLAEPVNDIVISWGALIQAVIDFILIALILFLIMKVVTSVLNRAKEVSEKFKKQKEEAEAESAEESEKPAEPEKKEVPADIALLTEIRDLLKSNASTTSEAETEKNN